MVLRERVTPNATPNYDEKTRKPLTLSQRQHPVVAELRSIGFSGAVRSISNQLGGLSALLVTFLAVFLVVWVVQYLTAH